MRTRVIRMCNVRIVVAQLESDWTPAEEEWMANGQNYKLNVLLPQKFRCKMENSVKADTTTHRWTR